MTPVLILVMFLAGGFDAPVIETQQIQFRTMEACQAAAEKLERDLAHLNAVALCVERVP
jgi:hypothetical protein